MTTIQLPPAVTNFVRTNQTTMLLSAGIAGAVGTAIVSWRGGMRAERIIANTSPAPATRIEKIRLVWKELIIPAAATGLTVVSIAGLDRTHTKKIASVAAAYALSEKALSDLKKETVEVVGEKKAAEIQEKVAQKVVNEIEEPPPGVVTVNEKQTLCLERYTQRYFWSNPEIIKRAELHVNQLLSCGENEVSMSEFYDDVELPHPDFAHDFGWVAGQPLRMTYASALTPNGVPVFTFEYNYVTNLQEHRRR